MKLADFIRTDAIIPELQSTERNGVIRELVDLLAKSVGLDEKDVPAIVKAIIVRENQATTGLGKGAAIPHVKHPAVKQIAGALGRSSVGIDFASHDRAPVYLVGLVLSPPDNPEQHLAAMEKIVRNLNRENFRRFLRQAASKEEMIEIIQEADELPG